jgi:hypothetical protein
VEKNSQRSAKPGAGDDGRDRAARDLGGGKNLLLEAGADECAGDQVEDKQRRSGNWARKSPAEAGPKALMRT